MNKINPTICILNLLHFCKTIRGHIGIADGCFAGEAWKFGEAAFKTIDGNKFGWIAPDGRLYTDDKSIMTRPTKEEVVAELERNPVLLAEAVKRGIASQTS